MDKNLDHDASAAVDTPPKSSRFTRSTPAKLASTATAATVAVCLIFAPKAISEKEFPLVSAWNWARNVGPLGDDKTVDQNQGSQPPQTDQNATPADSSNPIVYKKYSGSPKKGSQVNNSASGQNSGFEKTKSIRKQGTGSFKFRGFGPHPKQDIEVFYYAPKIDLSDAPILIVMTGRRRNGAEYRDIWKHIAEEEEAILLVPQFPFSQYPESQYNLGNLVNADNAPNPSDEWTFSVVEGLYDQIHNEVESNQNGYYLYGHSAGAQFVHRFMLFMKDSRVIRAVSANAGWYTVPSPDIEFPYGLRRSPASLDSDLSHMTLAPLTVLLGEEDNDPNADGLNTSAGAEAQGNGRFERGFNFYSKGQKLAESLGAPFNWRIEVVPGATHSNAEMAEAAAFELFKK